MKIARPPVPGWIVSAGLAAACASGPPGAATTMEPCPEHIEAGTLLRLDCRGDLTAGIAEWAVDGSAVVLDIRTGRSAQAVVEGWPPFDAAPWLGHDVSRVVVLPEDRIRVEFGEGHGVPVALFADRRLTRASRLADDRLDEDARDRIDRGEGPLRTRNEASVDYGRSLGREVALEGFDRRYMIVLREGVQPELAETIYEAVALRWVRSGVKGARRLPPSNADTAGADGPPARCATPPRGTELRSGSGFPAAESATAPTVSFPEGDEGAREIAGRLVSLTLGGAAGEWLGGSRLRVRPRAPNAEAPLAPTDVAVVAHVTVGGVHPCSVAGEVKRAVSWFGGGGSVDAAESGRVRTIAIGETAVFRIGGEVPGS